MRVWCFGCSFTRYFYPTWADILIKEAKQRNHFGENWGSCGKGNLYISIKIQECHARNNLGKDDWVFVCWSNYFREDVYSKKRGWHTPDFLFRQSEYKNGTANGFGSIKYYAIRDLSLIQSTSLSLKALGVNQFHFSILPMTGGDREINEVNSVYLPQFDAPPMMESLDLMLQEEDAKKNRIRTFPPENPSDSMEEWHPLPCEHLDYVKKYLSPKVNWLNNGITESTEKFIDLWEHKIRSMPEPIDLEKLGWEIDKISTQWI